MALLNGERHVEVVRIANRNTCVCLRIALVVRTYDIKLHISCTITVVSNVRRHLGTIHGCTPSIPVSVAAGSCTCAVAIAPAEVVGTQNSILTIGTEAQVALREHDEEVLPVVRATSVVVREGRHKCLASSNLYQTRSVTEEWRRVV